MENNEFNQPMEQETTNSWKKWLLIVIGIIIVIAAAFLIYVYAIKPTTSDSGSNPDSDQGSASDTIPAGSGVEYNCDTDTYNCGDFATQTEAQKAYDSCNELGFGDIHQLDSDGDGVVCEGLGG